MVRRFRLYVALLPVIVLVALHSALPSARATNTPYTKVTIQTNQGSWGNNLGDLNGDGFLDVAEGGGDLGGNVYWYSYPSWQRFLIGTDGGGDDLQIGDVNADGAPDVVVNGSGKIVWYQNPLATGGNVQGQWTKHTVDSTTQSHDIVLADLNADGRMDIIIRVELGRTYYYLQGNNADSWTKVFISQAPDGHGGLAVGDINRDGRLDIIENGFWLQAPTNYATGTWIRRDVVSWGVGSAAAAYDINHDGRLDIFLAASETGAGQLSWFEAPADPIGGTWIRHNIDNVEDVHRFFLVDVDKDGTEDLVFAEMHQSSAKRVGIYHNNGLGASWSLQVLATTGSHNIAVGDIGNDGDIDIIGANWETSSPDGGAQNLWRCDLNNSTTLDAWNYVQVDGSKSDVAFGLAFGDLNNDGRPDIISGEYWYRNPGGSMTGAWTRSRFGSVDAMLVTDVDGDGLLDVMAQSPSGGSVGIYWLEPTDASGSAWNSVLVGTIPASRDVTSQGYAIAQIFTGSRPQIIFSSDSGFYAFTVPSNPVGGNWPRVQLNSNGAQEGIAAGDINRDGKIDIAGTSHTSSGAQGREVDWWQNPGTGSGNWTKVVVGTTVNEADRIEVADINNDGRLDIVATDSDYDIARGNLSWFQQQAGGTWVKHSVVTNVGSLASMDVGDFNRDGLIDIVIGEHQNNSGPLLTTVLQNVSGGASWTSHLIGSGRESHEGTQAVDLDRDGDLDVVSIAYNTNQFVHLWRNDATAGPSPPDDTTPPTISSVHSSSVTTTAATIGWTTNEASNSQVNYGLTSTYGSSTPLDSALVTSHAVALSGLAASTTYHYRVNSRDAAGNLARSGDFTFTTGAASDSTPPTVAITNPTGGATVSGTVTLTVSANDNVGVAGVQYRLDGANIGAEVTSGPFSLSWNTASASNGNHSLTAIARDAAGNSTTSSAVTFTISNVAPPGGPIAFVQSAGTTADASATTMSLAFPNTTTAGNLIVAAVAWGRSGTLNCSDSRGNTYTTVGVEFDATRDESLGICYAANINGGSVTVTAAFNAGSAIWRRMLVHEYSGLATTTPFEVTAAQIGQATTAANSVTSTAATVSTAGALIFGAVMDDAATTTIQAGSGFVARASVNGADLASEDRVLGAAGSVAATWTFGAAHRYLARMVAFRPASGGGTPDTTPPSITNIAAGSITTTSATISWTTNEAADSQVDVGTTTAYGTTTPLDASLVTSHSVSVSGLSASTTYHYRVRSRDAAGNIAVSTDRTFTTPAAPDTTPPVISNVVSSGVTSSAATITWTTNEAADTQVDYGAQTTYGSTSPLNTAQTTSHSVTLTGLLPSTTYHYRARSRDAAGNLSLSTDFTVTTQAEPGGGGGGPIAFVQSAGTAVDASGTTLALAFPSTTTAGNLIVVAVAWGRDGGVTCSDSRGNAYATVGVQFDAQRDESLGICYAANISGGPVTVTAAFNAGSAIWRRMAIHEYSGVAAVNPVAATANNMAAGSTGSNAITSTAANVSTSGSLLFAAVMDTSGETNITAGTGFTTRRSVNGVELSSEDRIASTTGSAAATWTFGAAHRYLARLVIFRSEGQ